MKACGGARHHVKYPKSLQLPNHPTKSSPECRAKSDVENNISSKHNFDPQILSKSVVETFCRMAPRTLSKKWRELINSIHHIDAGPMCAHARNLPHPTSHRQQSDLRIPHVLLGCVLFWSLFGLCGISRVRYMLV